MFFTIERHAINAGSKFIRRLCTQILDYGIEKPVYENEQLQKIQNSGGRLCEEGAKLLKVAILGEPNAGKSTLINCLVNRHVCPTSSKAHTTRAKSQAIYSDRNTQLIFVDTPGIVTEGEHKRFKLTHTFKDDPRNSLKVADVIGIIQDSSNKYTRNKIHDSIIKLLKANYKHIEDKPMLLILNKVDNIKNKRLLLDIARQINTGEEGTLNFSDVFMISALNGDGVDDLRNYLMEHAKPTKWEYEECIYTDQAPVNIIEGTVKAKLLDNLPNEIPYSLIVKLQDIEVHSDGSIELLIVVMCDTTRIQHVVIGSHGKRIKMVASSSEEDLRNVFRTQVLVKIDVRVRKK